MTGYPAYDDGTCSADSDLIDPSALPVRAADLQPELIEASATEIAGIGTRVHAATDEAHSAWAGLSAPGVYVVSDSEAVYDFLTPALADAAEVQQVTARAGTVLSVYASALAGIRPVLDEFEARAFAFRVEALRGYEADDFTERAFHDHDAALHGGLSPISSGYGIVHVTWREHAPAVSMNQRLLGEYNEIREKISVAATACANALRAELTLVTVPAFQTATAEMLDASAQTASWGRPVAEQQNCFESAGSGVVNVATALGHVGMQAVGVDPGTGGWSLHTLGRTWFGIGDFLVSTVIVTTGWNMLAALPGPIGSFVTDRMNTAATGWGGLIG